MTKFHSEMAQELLQPKEKRLTVTVPAEVHLKMKTIASSRGMTMRELMLEAYEEYIEPKYEEKR